MIDGDILVRRCHESPPLPLPPSPDRVPMAAAMSQVRSLGGTEYQGWLGPKSLSRLDPRDDFVLCCGTWALIRALRRAKKFFLLDGVATSSEEATASAQDPWALVAADRERILSQESASVSAVRLFELLPRHSIAPAMKLLETSKPMASLAIELLTTVDVLNESTGKKRHRSFAYHRYMKRLRDGTEVDVPTTSIAYMASESHLIATGVGSLVMHTHRQMPIRWRSSRASFVPAFRSSLTKARPHRQRAARCEKIVHAGFASLNRSQSGAAYRAALSAALLRCRLPTECSDHTDHRHLCGLVRSE